MSRLRTAFEVLVIAYNRFVLHDAWAIASHIALSILMSMFPFLILVTALASMFGTGSLADEAADIILEAWPSEVAKPIADEVHSILTVRREGVLTLGLVLALYFASSGVEALRVGLNRAYGLRETRAWWFTRLESIAFVIGGAFVMLAFALLVVLGPLVWRGALYWLPGLRPFGNLIDFLRIGVATLLIVLALVMAHKLVPAGQRDFRSVLPGVGVTLALWILGGLGFGW
ncbi:MAG TPA: YihY/virulence factor BrkB family protein, partial [Microvirga sp.]|nr:YihY/virulence factor BrkB family protein [Microvirga sp.]